MQRSLVISVQIGLLALIGCGGGAPESAPDPQTPSVDTSSQEVLSVYTVNYPLQYLAERIGGELVEVTFLAPSDVDPAYWAPNPDEIASFQQADLILLNGMGYAKWLERATLPTSKLVDTSTGYQDRRIPLTEGAVHTHGPEGEHSHKGYAFTSWLDPRLAKEQAKSIAAAFSGAQPGSQDAFAANLASLNADLDELNSRLEAAAQTIGDQPLLFSHPVYQYLEAGYGLNARSVHWEPGEQPATELWQELEAILAEHPARWMIWEGEPQTATSKRLADLGVQSVVYDPCANAPSTGDLLSIMRGNVAALGSIAAAE